MKRLISLLLCLTLLLTLGSHSFADEQNDMQILNYSFGDDSLDLLLYIKTTGYFSDDSITLDLNGNELEIDSFEPCAPGDYGTSWIILLEPTGSPMTRSMILDMVKYLAERLGENDNAAVLDMSSGNCSEFLKSVSTISTLASNAVMGSGNVKLYDMVNAALDILDTNTELNEHKCLLLISNLTDDGSNVTVSELAEKAESSFATIYTLGLTDYNPSYTANFDSFKDVAEANNSSLAIAVDKIGEDYTESTVTPILDNEAGHSFRLAALYSNMSADDEESKATFTITLHQNEDKQLTLTLDSEELNAYLTESDDHEHEWTEATCTEPKKCTVCGETEGSALGHDYSEKTFFKSGVCSRCGDIDLSTWDSAMENLKENLLLVIAVAAALIAIVIFAMIRSKKKKRLKEERERRRREEAEQKRKEAQEKIRLENNVTKPVDRLKNDSAERVRVELVNPETNMVYSGEILDGMIAAGSSSPLLLSGDKSISRHHMDFIYEDGKLLVQDANSTNGTRVNGRQIKTAVILKQNDMIRAGSTNFRVNWSIKK